MSRRPRAQSEADPPPADLVAELRDVTARYRRGGGVADLSLTVSRGEWLALFGPSGSGKTTVLRLLAGRQEPEAGEVYVRSPRRSAARAMGYAAEENRLSRLLTVRQKLGLQLARSDVPTAHRRRWLADALEALDLYRDRDRHVHELSRGAQDALTLAAAIVHRPSLVLLDNLIARLPEPVTAHLFAYLDACREREGMAVVHATTSSAEAERADRVLMLARGHALDLAPPSELLARHAPERLCVEAADPEAVQRTLRGIFDVEIMETGEGLRFSAADGVATAAHLFRHPAGGIRAVYLRRPSLWEVHEKLRG